MKILEQERTWYWIVALLTLPAFLINLDIVPFIEDESIRALVAMEMRLKSDYIVPTLNDSLYFAKPPLYNWILLCFFDVFGGFTQWAARVPTVFFTLLMGVVVYFSSRTYFDKRHYAILAALMWVTCGRMLFYDSYLGLIDTSYSIAIFSLFMLVWHYGHQQRYTMMYVVVYTLGGLSYLFKGMPIFVFIPLTLLSLAVVQGRWKWLLKPQHLIGIAIMATIIGGYYYIYGQMAPIERSLAGLTEQSTMRTPIEHDLGPVIKHLFTYPPEYVYHFLPWSLLLLLAFRTDLLTVLRRKPFFYYCAVTFFFNITVYWISPGVYARYVLMLVPLTTLVGLYLYEVESEVPSWRIKALSKLLLFIVIALPVACFAGFFHPRMQALDGAFTIIPICAIVLAIMAYLYYTIRSRRPIILIAILLILRIGFDVLVLPSRAQNAFSAIKKADAIRVGQAYYDEELRLYKGSKLDYTGSFYLARERDRVTQRDYDDLDPGVYYMIDTSRYDVPPGVVLTDSISMRELRRVLAIGRLAD